jgi:hypothetical protein
MEFCYYDQEYCMDLDNVLQTYRNNIRLVLMFVYLFSVYNFFTNMFMFYSIRNDSIEINKSLILISKELENKELENKESKKKKWFIDYSVE